MKLSFIIVNYKVEKEVIRLVDSIIKFCDVKKFEIIIADNSEKSNLKQKLKKYGSLVAYIKLQSNLGFGAGCNAGAEIAKGEFLFLINPDTEIVEGKLSSLLKLFENNKVGAVSPMLLDKNLKPYQQGAKILTPLRAIFSLSLISRFFPKNRIRRNYYYDEKNINAKTQIEVLPGTAFIMKKELFKKIGKFDQNYFLYFEEFDLFKRLYEKGFKNYISNKLKISHKWGESTKKRNDIDKIFEKSRFYYFKKNFGIVGVLTDFLLRIRVHHVLFFLILLVASFLRFYKLDQFMIFLGDQGWYYLSALEMIKTGNIPLVGIPSSVIWLHQGAFATYLIAASLYIGNLNPVAPAYFFAVLDVLTIILIYLASAKLFNKWVGVLSAFFYATSPLILVSARTPYHTSPIPFFFSILLLLFAFYKKEHSNLFIFLIFLTWGLLIQLELSNAVSILIIIVFLKIKKIFVNRALVISTFLGTFLGLLPFILFDLKNNFVQTLGFPIWIINRIRLFFGLSIKNDSTFSNLPEAFKTIYDQISALFATNIPGLIVLFSFALVFLWIYLKKDKGNYLIIISALLFPIFSFIIHSAPGVAYFPLIFPTVAILVGFIFYNFTKIFRLSFLILVVFGILNSFQTFKNDFFVSTDVPRVISVSNYNYGFTYKEPLKVANFIDENLKGESVNIEAEGVNKMFSSSLDNIKFILKTKGIEINANGETFVVSDKDFNMKNPDFITSVYKVKKK